MKFRSSARIPSEFVLSGIPPKIAKPSLAVFAAIALYGSGAQEVMAQAAPSLETQLQSLKNEVDDLQKKVNEQKKSVSSQGTGIAAGPLTLNFGGFTELAGIYRNRNETADVGSNFNTAIPFANSAQNHLSEFRASARQSRLSIQVLGPQDGNSSAEAYYETDFLGAAPTANSNESNSYNLRMRHIYGLYTRKDADFYVLAGQNWSLATLYKKGLAPKQEQVPLTIDAQYAVGFNWTRNSQVRVVKNLGKKASLGISFESPQTLIAVGPNALTNVTYNNAGGSLFSSTNNYSLDYAPDIIAKVAFDPGWGHYELYGLERSFRDRAAGHNNTATSTAVGGGLILPLVANVLEFQASALVGDGIGRYGSTQLPDITILSDGSLAKVHERHYLAGLSLKPISILTFYGYYGEERADAKYNSALSSTGTALGYGYGSPLYNNSGCLVEGNAAASCVANTRSIKQAAVGLWWKYYQGTLGNLQFGLQGSHTKRETFAGVGGSPDTSLNVAMISFRYYPYQK